MSAARKKDLAKLFVVRNFDTNDGWLDVTGPLSKEAAQAEWLKRTDGGTRWTKFEELSYFAIFPADTRMLYSEENVARMRRESGE
jgi:hypothetical protein